jgi:hypothetical protein
MAAVATTVVRHHRKVGPLANKRLAQVWTCRMCHWTMHIPDNDFLYSPWIRSVLFAALISHRELLKLIDFMRMFRLCSLLSLFKPTTSVFVKTRSSYKGCVYNQFCNDCTSRNEDKSLTTHLITAKYRRIIATSGSLLGISFENFFLITAFVKNIDETTGPSS